MKKAVTVVLSVLCAIFLALGLAACGKGKGDTYEITVKSVGGTPLYDVVVSLYDGNNEVASTRTDQKGVARLTAKAGAYVITLDELPAGYRLPTTAYRTDPEKRQQEIFLNSGIIERDPPKGKVYKVGDVMYDFSVTTSTGKEFRLSDAFKDGKTLVLINLWATWCGPCKSEFPSLANSYSRYNGEKQVEVIALSSYDSNPEINNFIAEFDGAIPFEMAYDSLKLSSMFKTSGVPVSIFVDRYGVCAEIHQGSLPKEGDWDARFAKYTDPNYSQNFKPDTDNPDEIELIKPYYKMPESALLEEAANGMNSDGTRFNGTYRAVTEKDDSQYEYYWPWLTARDENGTYIYSSNKAIQTYSYSGVFLDFHMSKNQALTFDLSISTETGCDYFNVIGDGLNIYKNSGIQNETVYTFVANEDGDYTLLFNYSTDFANEDGAVYTDDVIIRNIRLIDKSEIPGTVTVDSRYHCSTNPVYAGDGTQTGWKNYVKVGLNPVDGYYHLLDQNNQPNGPFVLADLHSNYTHFSNMSVASYVGAGTSVTGLSDADTATLQRYLGYASLSDIKNYTPVTEELKDVLVKFCQNLSGDATHSNENEWLELCSYYVRYGKGDDVFGSTDPLKHDPIKGCAPFCSVKLKETTGIPEENYKDDYNQIDITRIYMPRGIYAEFTPDQTGLFRFRSYGKNAKGEELDTMCYITDENGEELTLKSDEMASSGTDHFTVYLNLEAGKCYFVRCDFYTAGELGTFYLGIEHITEDSDEAENGVVKVERRMGYGVYTFDLDIYEATGGQVMYNTPEYLPDNYGQDADGNWAANINVPGRRQSKIYLDLMNEGWFPAIEKVFYPATNAAGKPVTLSYMTRDRNGEPIYKRDANGNIVYEKDDKNNDVPVYAQTFKLDFDFTERNDGIDYSEDLNHLWELTGERITNYNAYMLELVDNARKTGNPLVEVTEELSYILNMFVHRLTSYRTPDIQLTDSNGNVVGDWAKGVFVDSMATSKNPAREWILFCVYFDYYTV